MSEEKIEQSTKEELIQVWLAFEKKRIYHEDKLVELFDLQKKIEQKLGMTKQERRELKREAKKKKGGD